MGRIIIIVLFCVAACAPQLNNPLSNSFHNMTAHYNSYFIAKERIHEIEQTIFDAQEWNFNKILPIHPQFDSAQSAVLKEPIEDCVQKSSISILRHPDSKWEDDSYILVGKARYYALEFPDAIETFKYVNTHSKKPASRHEALAELIRAFTDFNEYNNAIAVVDFLAKEDLNRRSKRLYHLNTAYLYQKRGDEDKMVFHLVKAEELYPNSKERARINFIIGQTYHSLDFESEAYRYYKKVLKNNPTYELEFYSKLYIAQVSKLTKTSTLKKIQKYFKNLLKDPKNDEYRDKIFYERAGFKLNNGFLADAIKDYKNAIRASKTNKRQKGLAYLRLGEIYYDSLRDFSLAKSYYDSTVATLPKDEENYEAIKNRQSILEDFIKQIDIIKRNDSLLVLSGLPKDSLFAIAVKKIETERKREIEKKKQEKKERQRRLIADNSNPGLIATLSTNSVWYFSNTNALSKGMNEFIRKWGDRPLEDNWRRKNKTDVAAQSQPVDIIQQKREGASGIESPEFEDNIEQLAKKSVADVPATEEEKNKLLREIEDAYYELGNIYNLRLEEDQNAIATFELLLSRFPESPYEPDVLYQLFLIYKPVDVRRSLACGEELHKKYPGSVYAQLVKNPNYKEESRVVGEKLRKLYRKLYNEYEKGNHNQVIYGTDSVLSIYPKNEFSDNIKLLQILAMGKSQGNRKYQFEIGNFPKLYPDSELIEHVGTLRKASEEFQQNRYNSSRAKFIQDFDQKHYFVIVFEINEETNAKLSELVENFLKENNFSTLKTGNLILNKGKSMLLVNEFPGKATAKGFSKLFADSISLSDHFKGKKLDIFLITENNFDIFYKTKDVTAYLNFFEKHY